LSASALRIQRINVIALNSASMVALRFFERNGKTVRLPVNRDVIEKVPVTEVGEACLVVVSNNLFQAVSHKYLSSF